MKEHIERISNRIERRLNSVKNIQEYFKTRLKKKNVIKRPFPKIFVIWN